MHVRRESFLRRTEKIATLVRLLIQRFNHYIGRERGFVIIDRAYQELILNSVKKKRSAFQISKKSKNESNKV